MAKKIVFFSLKLAHKEITGDVAGYRGAKNEHR
jgi:hypothetical protein